MADINLADVGLTNGDRIDPYLDDHFDGGNHVTIPAGTYEWNGDGLSINTNSDASLVGEAPGEVIFDVQRGARFTPNWNVDGNSEVRIANIHFRGVTTSSSQSRIGVWPQRGSTLLAEHLYFPDGNDGSASCRPFYSSTDRTGTALFRNCFIANWTNNGFYVNKGEGPTILENCVVRNNNIGQIRIGASGSRVSNCLVILDDRPPTDANSSNSRGVRIRSAGRDILIEDTDFIWTYSNGNPIAMHSEASGGSGVIRGCRFHSVREPINDKGGGGNWIAQDCDFTGSNQSVGVETRGCRFGSDAQAPTKTIEGVLGTDLPDGGGTIPTPEPEPEPDPPEPIDGDVLEIIARQHGPLNYEFRVDGLVARHETDGHEPGDRVVSGSNDTISTIDDMTVVSGFTGNAGQGDAYIIRGDLQSFIWDDGAYDFDLWLDGVQIDPADYGEPEDPEDPAPPEEPEPEPEPPDVPEPPDEPGPPDKVLTENDVVRAVRRAIREELPKYAVGAEVLRIKRVADDDEGGDGE